jgi:hypothetical protein
MLFDTWIVTLQNKTERGKKKLYARYIQQDNGGGPCGEVGNQRKIGLQKQPCYDFAVNKP